MRKIQTLAVAAVALLASADGIGQTTISIDQTLRRCRDAGNTPVPGALAVQSDLKREASLIGMAYLNFIYQNDIANKHFCESMLLMNSQVPAGTRNEFVGLFTPRRAVTTMAVLADVQLSFDYAIARTSPAEASVRSSVDKVRRTIK